MYIGEEASSIIGFFGVVGPPLEGWFVFLGFCHFLLIFWAALYAPYVLSGFFLVIYAVLIYQKTLFWFVRYCPYIVPLLIDYI